MQGKAALLNKRHMYNWTVINELAHATEKPHTAPIKLPALIPRANTASACQKTATQLIRQRRSAQHFNPQPTLAEQDFYRILTATLPDKLPFDVWSLPNNIHLFIFCASGGRVRSGFIRAAQKY